MPSQFKDRKEHTQASIKYAYLVSQVNAKTKNPPTPQLISDMTLQMAMSLNGLGDSEGDFTGGEFCTGGKPNRGLDLSCTFQVEVAVDIQPCGKV